jgi:hypothetical protein
VSVSANSAGVPTVHLRQAGMVPFEKPPRSVAVHASGRMVAVSSWRNENSGGGVVHLLEAAVSVTGGAPELFLRP